MGILNKELFTGGLIIQPVYSSEASSTIVTNYRLVTYLPHYRELYYGTFEECAKRKEQIINEHADTEKISRR